MLGVGTNKREEVETTTIQETTVQQPAPTTVPVTQKEEEKPREEPVQACSCAPIDWVNRVLGWLLLLMMSFFVFAAGIKLFRK